VSRPAAGLTQQRSGWPVLARAGQTWPGPWPPRPRHADRGGRRAGRREPVTAPGRAHFRRPRQILHGPRRAVAEPGPVSRGRSRCWLSRNLARRAPGSWPLPTSPGALRGQPRPASAPPTATGGHRRLWPRPWPGARLASSQELGRKRCDADHIYFRRSRPRGVSDHARHRRQFVSTIPDTDL
jgi:hypothetical protein